MNLAVCDPTHMPAGVQLELEVIPETEAFARALDVARYGKIYYNVLWVA